ncbi:hypothetical protein [Caballeronia grimmiae]|uniref:Transcriptional regulator n=1 Tax=Caballeronia grimmiae TaxID=1071679 RepID=A0A069NFX5_9BURK|nr:hypothetical protein [Caballeronia grimmiae]KDR27225.1 hypothetical protein BG57_23555 [Caballeronia grimmiae]GGD69878.1 hypothetical protein GCM10010985_25480 [Caballeronia grimmiae]
MKDAIELEFKEFLVTGLALPDGTSFAAMVIVRLPSGDRVVSGLLGRFDTRHQAQWSAIEHGLNEIERFLTFRGGLNAA